MSIIPVIMTIASYIVVNTIIPWNLYIMLLEGIIFVIIFIILTWFFTMNKYEKDIFKGLIKNIPIIKTSTKENIGIDIFEEQIKEMFFNGEISFNDQIYITNMRHKEALEDAKKSLLMVQKSIEDDMPEDFLSIDLMSAYASLGTIIGEEVGEDLVNEIFSKFCMGK